MGLRTLFGYTSSVANERSDPRIGPGTFFRLGSLVRAESNGEIGPRTFFRLTGFNQGPGVNSR
jgi:hypothetical protein